MNTVDKGRNVPLQHFNLYFSLKPLNVCEVVGGWFESKFSVELLLIPNLVEQYLKEKCEAEKSNRHISHWLV